MRNSLLLKSVPTAAVRSRAEMHAVAWALAETAAARYDSAASELAAADADAMEPVRDVLEYLGRREHARIAELEANCPQAGDLVGRVLRASGPSIDPVPQEELSELLNSSLATAYQAWALAVRNCERAFVFWTYVAAHCRDMALKTIAEQMAREALNDGNSFRRERRLAWRAERRSPPEDPGRDPSELSSAALLESLLFKEVVRWARTLPAAERAAVLTAAGYSGDDGVSADIELPALADGQTVDDVKNRAIHYAEQLASIYLDEADRATDQASLDLAQDSASASINRMAALREKVRALRSEASSDLPLSKNA